MKLRWRTWQKLVKEISQFKGPGVECHIDSPGEPVMYPYLPELIAALRQIDEVSVISLQTNGTLLTPAKIAALEGAGLNGSTFLFMLLTRQSHSCLQVLTGTILKRLPMLHERSSGAGLTCSSHPCSYPESMMPRSQN